MRRLNLGRRIELIAAHHLIHRKRSPFPYRGKALNAAQWEHSPAVRQRGMMLRELELQYRALLSIETSSTANAVPLPLIGEGNNATESGRTCECPAQHFRFPASEALPRDGKTRSPRGAANTFPYEGKGDRLRWMRSAIAKHARHSKSRPH